MWIPKDNEQDPYNRGANATGKAINIGSGAGSGAPLGAGEGNQTNANPSTINPTQNIPQQKSATVQDYLGANKAQGNQLGQQFKTKLETKAGEDKSAIDTSALNVKNKIASSTTAFDPTITNTVVTDATKIADSPDQLQSFLKQWNAAYTGPSTFESTTDYNTAANAASDAKTKSEQIKDAGGRKQILQDEFAVYGQGNKGLDHTLLQNSDEFAGIQNLGTNFSMLPDYFANQAKDVNQMASQARDTSDQTKNQTRDAVNTGISALDKTLGTQEKTIKTSGATIPDYVQNFLSRLPPNPDDNDLAMAGLNRGEYNGILQSIGMKSSDTNISNPLYAANPEYSRNLANYLAMQQIRNKAINSQF